MPDNDQRRGVEARGADHCGAVRGGGVRVGRTAVTGWALASVLAVAGFGTAMGATPAPVPQPVAVADTTDTTDTAGTSTGAVGLDPLALLPTARALSPSAVLPNLPTIGPAPAATAPETAAPQTGTGGVVAPVPGAQLRQAQFTTDAPDTRAALAIRTALAQIGLPYVWGGNGPTNGDAGFDCSGLTTFSYASAGVGLPRTAHTQYNAGPHVPDGAPLQPGDLVFYGTTARVHHVGMYLGAGRMVNAPTFGRPVQVAFYRYPGDDYVGATRPAASPGSLTSGILPFVDPATLPAVPPSAPEQIFTAPTAPMVALPQPGDPNLPPEQVSAAQAVQEAAAVALVTGPARSAAVAGATASTSVPVTTDVATDPAAVGTATTGSAHTGTATAGVTTSTTPSTAGAVAGTTTSSTAPVTSAPASGTDPATAPQVGAGSSTATSPLATTPAPVTTRSATPTTKKAAVAPKSTAPKVTAEPKTTAPKSTADDVSTAKAVKTTAEDDDATTAEKSTEKSSEKSTEESTEKSSEKSTEKSTESDSGDSGGSDGSDQSDDEG